MKQVPKVITQNLVLQAEETPEVAYAFLQCITPLLKCDGWSITTVEGVGTPDDLDEVQSRLVSNNGTQCGFCTPGFVMSMNRWVPNIVHIRLVTKCVTMAGSTTNSTKYSIK